MKRLLMTAVCIAALGLAAPASAADMAVKDDLQLERFLHRRQRRLGPKPQLRRFRHCRGNIRQRLQRSFRRRCRHVLKSASA